MWLGVCQITSFLMSLQIRRLEQTTSGVPSIFHPFKLWHLFIETKVSPGNITYHSSPLSNKNPCQLSWGTVVHQDTMEGNYRGSATEKLYNHSQYKWVRKRERDCLGLLLIVITIITVSFCSFPPLPLWHDLYLKLQTFSMTICFHPAHLVSSQKL